MKIRILSLVGLALAVCLATSSLAQQEDQQPRRGRGQGGPGGQRGGGFGGGGFGGGGFGGMMGRGMAGSGIAELLRLLDMEEVRKEIDMEDDTYESVQTAMREIRGDMRGMRDMSPEERTAAMKKMDEESQELADEVLDPGQRKRLLGLLAQQNGARAVMNKLIADEIKLDEDGQKKAQEALQKSMEGMREKMRPADGERPDFAKMQEMMQEAMKDAEKAVMATLTDEQKADLEKLKGDKFEFPAPTRRGPGGRGGAGGRPGRPGGNNNP